MSALSSSVSAAIRARSSAICSSCCAVAVLDVNLSSFTSTFSPLATSAFACDTSDCPPSAVDCFTGAGFAGLGFSLSSVSMAGLRIPRVSLVHREVVGRSMSSTVRFSSTLAFCILRDPSSRSSLSESVFLVVASFSSMISRTLRSLREPSTRFLSTGVFMTMSVALASRFEPSSFSCSRSFSTSPVTITLPAAARRRDPKTRVSSSTRASVCSSVFSGASALHRSWLT
mmetsp:Transcript_12049/g.28376  ORF Transcript_12049/g.28376 Transcript_12049/m.28376 type:complete len:229 (+) Transcript_12049:1585-2271(+)